VTSDGVTSDGVTSDGATSDGVTSDGATLRWHSLHNRLLFWSSAAASTVGLHDTIVSSSGVLFGIKYVQQGFEEGKIHFPPTFKFKQGSSEYSEQRVPSWTDRILWRVRTPEEAQQWESLHAGDESCGHNAGNAAATCASVVQAYYTSLPELTSSDHKPVVAGFDVQLASQELPSMPAAPTKHRCTIM
jgi:hypothetical protein